MRQPRITALFLAVILQSCSKSEDRHPLSKIESPYIVKGDVLDELRRDTARRVAWDSTVFSCRTAMNMQRDIGAFEGNDVTDAQIDSYCNCVADEAYRDRTTQEISEMEINRETGICRRYYREVKPSEIAPA